MLRVEGISILEMLVLAAITVLPEGNVNLVVAKSVCSHIKNNQYSRRCSTHWRPMAKGEVLLIRTTTMEAAEQVRTHILNNWQDFITIYKGTTAQYTTLARVKHLFGKC